MNNITKEHLWKDTQALWKEYKIEDRDFYECLFREYFKDLEHNEPQSKALPTISWCVHKIFIEIDRFHNPVKTSFVSTLNLQEYTEMLRKESVIRTFTKLCFYIEENIKPYSSIDKDIPKRI